MVSSVDETTMSVEEIDSFLDEKKEFKVKDRVIDEEILLRRKNLMPMNDMLNGLSFEKKAQDKRVKWVQAEEVKALPLSVDLSEYNQYVVNQWNGTCTAHAAVASMENFLCKHKGFCQKFSERHLWETYKKYSSVEAHKALNKNYVALDKFWPHKSTVPVVTDITKEGISKMTSYIYLGNDENAVKQNLAMGYPVVIAMTTPEDMTDCPEVIDPMSNPLDGGHAISVIGYTVSDKYGLMLKLKNSWGTSCGKKGYQYLPYSICKRSAQYYCDFWAFKDFDLKGVKPTPVPNPEPPKPNPTPNPEPPKPNPVPTPKVCVEFKKLWPPKCWFSKNRLTESCCKRFE
jgi:C1A family cysteine protease